MIFKLLRASESRGWMGPSWAGGREAKGLRSGCVRGPAGREVETTGTWQTNRTESNAPRVGGANQGWALAGGSRGGAALVPRFALPRREAASASLDASGVACAFASVASVSGGGISSARLRRK